MLVAPRASFAAPVVEPQLRDIADAAQRGGPTPEHLQRYTPVDKRADGDWVSVWLQGPVDRGAIEALGGQVGTVAGKWTTARVPVRALDALTRAPGLERVQLAQGLQLQSDVSVPMIGAPVLWGGIPPNYPSNGKTGKRVVVGIVDAGIYLKHADFKKPGTTKTRVAWLWDQGGQNAPKPSFRYGTEYPATAIDSGKASTVQEQNPHGTWMAGAAAGNGQGTGNGKLPYKYVGVAPEADLVVVEVPIYPDGSTPDAQIVDGVNYVFQKAAALGEPAVCVVAAGKITGPHDGHDPLDEAITALTGPGKVVFVSAGNYAGTSRHAVAKTISLNQNGTVTFTVPTHPAGLEHINIEGWYSSGANYSVSLTNPSGQVLGPVLKGASSSATWTNESVTLANGTYTTDNGSSRVYIAVGGITGHAIDPGTWTITINSKVSGSYKGDFWLTDFIGFTPVFAQGMTDSCLVTSPATADSVIAVGAYTTRPSWVALDGSTYIFFGATMQAIAGFSSAGPRRDGVVCPQITGPGQGVAVARSYLPLSPYFMPDSAHCMVSGTSVAAALTAGAAALVMQSYPTYGRAGILAYLKANAVVDTYTGLVPNNRWGWGKLKLATVSQTAVGPARPTAVQMRLLSASPGRGAMRFEVDLSPSEAASGRAAVKILDVAGRQVATMPVELRTGPQSVTWDGSADGRVANAGLYWARLEVGHNASSVRFALIH